MSLIRKKELLKLKACPHYSSEVIRYSLLLRYTSYVTYNMLLNEFPPLSFAQHRKLQSGGPYSITAVNVLIQNGAIFSDVVVIADEMYL